MYSERFLEIKILRIYLCCELVHDDNKVAKKNKNINFDEKEREEKISHEGKTRKKQKNAIIFLSIFAIFFALWRIISAKKIRQLKENRNKQ